MTADLLAGWPLGSAASVFRLRDGVLDDVAHAGDLEVERPWASVSKMAVAFAAARDVANGRWRYEDPVDPPGATMASLLSHSSGLGFERDDRVVAPGTRRVYSNEGIDRLATIASGTEGAAAWLDRNVFAPLAMGRTRLEGRAAAGVVGPTAELVNLAVAWLEPRLITPAQRDRAITPYLPELDGIVPGFGRFRPCPWGLGPEVRGSKQHWMGDWPAASFGHFGQSGALLLVNADEQIGVVATSPEPFGPWAVALWPSWSSMVRRLALEERA